MATPTGRPPAHGGSHFDGGAHNRSSSSSRSLHAHPRTSRPARPAASTSRVGSSRARVSARSAEATRRAQNHCVRRAPKPSARSRLPLIAAGVAAFVGLVCVVVLVVVPRLTGGSGDGAPKVAAGTQVTLTIPEGSGASEVAQALYEAGVITSTSEFLSQAHRTEADQGLKSGTYTFTAGDELTNVINLLVSGPNASSSQLTVPEGYSVARTAQAAQDALGISADEFVAQAKASNYASDYAFLADVADDSLEGYLFPKTYDFSGKEVSADVVIRAMLSQYQSEVAPLDLAGAAATLSSRYGVELDENDVVTLASIVEREALTDDQRGQVASVFYNRLAAGMDLQSDATLAYSLGREVTADDLKVDDPYNTYTRSGLTPTPICSPSLKSLAAAASPDDTGYYYFYISGDYAVFSETYEQHQQAIDNRPQ